MLFLMVVNSFRLEALCMGSGGELRIGSCIDRRSDFWCGLRGNKELILSMPAHGMGRQE